MTITLTATNVLLVLGAALTLIGVLWPDRGGYGPDMGGCAVAVIGALLLALGIGGWLL